ncbi:hypothetical protein E2C01_083078 [Portunus trituberculatus]|uniref:Uncharacterized protein n=1 Tax=Portunus trituberculatus TaxID=210409 RepID=A0A5B7IRI4_PORTR|nr:hypothetical protein [Portunus trituberculatus]
MRAYSLFPSISFPSSSSSSSFPSLGLWFALEGRKAWDHTKGQEKEEEEEEEEEGKEDEGN